jgi:hypothetical protein
LAIEATTPMVKEHLQDVGRQYERLAVQATALSRRELSDRSPLDQIRSRVSLRSIYRRKPQQVFKIVFPRCGGRALCRAGSGLGCVRPRSRAALGWIGRLNCVWSIAWRLVLSSFATGMKISGAWRRPRLDAGAIPGIVAEGVARGGLHTGVLGEGPRDRGRAPPLAEGD